MECHNFIFNYKQTYMYDNKGRPFPLNDNQSLHSSFWEAGAWSLTSKPGTMNNSLRLGLLMESRSQLHLILRFKYKVWSDGQLKINLSISSLLISMSSKGEDTQHGQTNKYRRAGDDTIMEMMPDQRCIAKDLTRQFDVGCRF